MKKYFIAFLLLFVLSFVISKPVYNFLTKGFMDFIAEKLEKEEIERTEKIANGDIVRGKDTVLIWKNKYDITKHMGEKALDIYVNSSNYQVIDKITKHCVVNDKLYIVSEEGYAVIDENKKCRVFINKFVKDGNVDYGESFEYKSGKIESTYITYLSDYNEFSEEERIQFGTIN